MTDLRRLPEQAPSVVVLLIAAVGMIRVLTQHWVQGAVLLGGAAVVAAALRAILPPERAGLLAIRGRAVDVLCYGAFGLVILVLAIQIRMNLVSD